MERIEEFKPNPIYDAPLKASPVSPWPPAPLPVPPARKASKPSRRGEAGR